jgi:hypothetical protein
MKPLMCLTPFLESGKKFKLESGETYDDLAIDKKYQIKTDQYDNVEKVDKSETDKT